MNCIGKRKDRQPCRIRAQGGSGFVNERRTDAVGEKNPSHGRSSFCENIKEETVIACESKIANSRFVTLAGLLVLLPCLRPAPDPGSCRFVILGDRTGEAQLGVYEQVWREVAAETRHSYFLGQPTYSVILEIVRRATIPVELTSSMMFRRPSDVQRQLASAIMDL
jgi:hypothetical protein